MRNIERKTLLFSSILALTLYATAAQAQDNNDWEFNGQVQTRFELDGRDFNNQTMPLTFASNKVKFSVKKTVFDRIDFFAQARDSRVFGFETNTLATMGNLDLHQGYAKIRNAFDAPLDVQVGRFEVSYGTQRFLGAVGWHFVGRSWDGLRLTYKPLGNTKIDAFGLRHNTSTPYIGNATAATYGTKEDMDKKKTFDLYGFWANSKINDALNIDLFGYFENDMRQATAGTADLQRLTAGLNHQGKYGPFSSLFEAAYQYGSNKGNSVNAYLVSLQGFYNLGYMKFGLGADILSGNNPSSAKTSNAFAPTYGTNHKFYGLMDYFINVPGNSGNLGLNDYYGQVGWNNPESPFSANLTVHHFASNQTSASNLNDFGQEADLTLKYKVEKNTTVTWGNSLFLPGQLMKSDGFFKDKTDLAYWSYLMLTTNF